MRYFQLTPHLRLTALGASIGGVAAVVFLVPTAALLHASSNAFPRGDAPPVFDPIDWATSLAIANVAAGAVAGALAASVPASARVRGSRASLRAWVVCLGGGVTWALLATALEQNLRPSPTRLVWSAFLGIALGALLNVALFPTIVAAMGAAGPRLHRQVWAGASRLAAFSAGLLGTLLAGPLTLGAGTVIAGILLHGWPSDPVAARSIGPLFVSCITAVLMAFVGLRVAGVPRHWPRERTASQPPDAQ